MNHEGHISQSKKHQQLNRLNLSGNQFWEQHLLTTKKQNGSMNMKLTIQP